MFPRSTPKFGGRQLHGAIFIDDVDASPQVGRVKCGAAEIAVRALSAETMYIVKTAADRGKDQTDMKNIAKRCEYDGTLRRAKVLFPRRIPRTR